MKLLFCRKIQNNILIIVFLIIKVIFTQRSNFLNNAKDDKFSLEEIQNQLSIFINNLEKIRKVDGENNTSINSFTKIDIKSVYDLRSILESYFILYNDFLKLKGTDINQFKTKLDFFDNNLKSISKNISKNDQLHKSEIEKSTLLSRDISEKNKSNFELISEIEGVKNNFEMENKKEINLLNEGKFSKEAEEIIKSDNSKQILGNFHQIFKENQESIKSRLDTTLNTITSTNKLASIKTEEVFLSENKNSDEYDLKIMDLILENIQFNYNKFKEEVNKKIDSLNKLKKSINKSGNLKQLQKEKEDSKDNYEKNVKELELKQAKFKEMVKENDKLFAKRKILNEKLNKKIIEKKILFGEKTKSLNTYNIKLKELDKNRKDLKTNEKKVSFFFILVFD